MLLGGTRIDNPFESVSIHFKKILKVRCDPCFYICASILATTEVKTKLDPGIHCHYDLTLFLYLPANAN